MSLDDTSVHARLGFALYLTDHRAAAIKHWEEAPRLDPSLPGLRERFEQARGK